MTPTQRTIRVLETGGFTCDIAERKITSRITKDLFGFIDLVAIHPKSEILAVQITTGTNHAARRKKILAEPRALTWLRAGGYIQVRSWSKRKVKRGGKATKWTERVEEITEEEITRDAARRKAEAME